MTDQIAQFVKTVRGRNIRETIAVLLLIGIFGAQLLLGDHSTLGVVGRVVAITAAIVIGFVTWGFLHIPTSELQQYPPDQNVGHWRRRLTTQARGLQLAWLWYVLPLFAGIVLIYLGRTDSLAGTMASIAVPLFLAAIIGWLNMSAGRSIEADRDKWLPPE